MTTYRVTLEYDGTAYSGWQWQPAVPTVEGALRGAISSITGERPRLTAAGRTDAGAHAHGQVAGFALEGDWNAERLLTGLNGRLPADVAVRHLAEAPECFHARFDAVDRTYRYLVSARRSRRALGRQYAWGVSGPLDLEAMRSAARLLEGSHDFAGLGRSPRQGGTTQRTIHRLRVRRLRSLQPQGADCLVIEVRADAFLYGMMRSVAGALVGVGEGRMDAAQLHAVLEGAAGPLPCAVAPAHGLHQWSVSYPAAAIAPPAPAESS